LRLFDRYTKSIYTHTIVILPIQRNDDNKNNNKMFSILFLLFLAAFCAQVSSLQCLDTEGARTAVDEWLDDKSTAEFNYDPIAGRKFCNGTSLGDLFYADGDDGGNVKARDFEEDISGWDTSGVSSMFSMFGGASAFNQDLSEWDTSSVKDMDSMFFGATVFNQDVSQWDTSKVTSMEWMFLAATSFNQDISKWDTGKVMSMEGMFLDTTSFGICLVWDISMVGKTLEMFTGSNGDAGCTAQPTQQPLSSPSSTPFPFKSLIVLMTVGVVALSIAGVVAIYFSRIHSATFSEAQSISSKDDHDIVNNNDDNGLRSSDRLQPSSNIVITPGKKQSQVKLWIILLPLLELARFLRQR